MIYLTFGLSISKKIKLLAILLPHLKFERVDTSDTGSPKIIFNKYTSGSISYPQNQVDTDKLSRVEKEVISQFLPLFLRRGMPYPKTYCHN